MSNTDDPAFAATAFAHPPAPLGAPPEAGPIGRTLNGRYKIKRLLGEGGMGGVYEGEHLEIGKRVAIKLVHSLHAHDPQIAARLKQEARSTSAIESEHIVQIFDAGQDDELGLFLVMELLKGEDLGNILARNKRLQPSSAAMLVAQAAWGLSRAHAAGIVHRDLKPANVFVVTRDDGSSLVKLVDFGIAKLVRDANQQAHAHGPGITRMGMVIGTPQYMSPEQAQGLPSVDQRTDVYSLGAVLFEAIVGESPFREMPTYEQTILQIMTQRAPRLSERMADIPPELDRLCSEMMAMDPSHRPPNMHAVRERLLAIFPDVPGARASTRSLTNEIGNDVTAFAGGPASGEVQRLIAAAQLAQGPASGPVSGTAILRPATHSAVAVDSSARARLELADDDEDDAVLPLSRPGRKSRKKRALIAAVSIVGLALLVGVVGLARMRGTNEPKAQGGYGLVQSSIEGATAPGPAAANAAAALPAITAPAQINAPVAAIPAALPAVAPSNAAPASPPPSASPASPLAAHAKGASRSSKSSAAAATKGSASAPVTKEADAPVARPVGGTGVSTEF